MSEIRCYDSSNKGRILGHCSCSKTLTKDILTDEHTGHISGKCNILACLCILCIDSESVGIGVRCHYDIGILFLCKLKSKLESSLVLGIGIYKSCKVGIGKLLLGNDINILESELA